MHTLPLRTRRQCGTTLLEALVAFLVLSLGMLTVARVQTQLRGNADVARQRSEAVRLAQEDLESLRAFAVLAVSAGQRSYDAIASGSRPVDADSGYATHTRYLVARQIDATVTPCAKSALVTVSWTDRGGNAQQVALSSVIAGVDPAYSGALGLARSAAAVRGPLGRSIAIPLSAKDLGNGTSAAKPAGGATVAYVFDNLSGAVLSRCSGIGPATATRDLVPADLARCENSRGELLSGVVRFKPGAASDPAAGRDTPPALAVSLALSGGTYASAPECSSEPVKTVTYNAAGSLHIDAVPLAATPATLGLPGWTDTGERHVAYQCVVYPLADGRWSGAVTLVPTGWSIGTGASDRRVCRYTSDLDGSGAIDANLEHPAAYAGVGSALAHQDYLVIPASETCPRGDPTAHAAGIGPDGLASSGTAQHQP